jgi:hypothetical protein
VPRRPRQASGPGPATSASCERSSWFVLLSSAARMRRRSVASEAPPFGGRIRHLLRPFRFRHESASSRSPSVSGRHQGARSLGAAPGAPTSGGTLTTGACRARPRAPWHASRPVRPLRRSSDDSTMAIRVRNGRRVHARLTGTAYSHAPRDATGAPTDLARAPETPGRSGTRIARSWGQRRHVPGRGRRPSQRSRSHRTSIPGPARTAGPRRPPSSAPVVA